MAEEKLMTLKPEVIEDTFMMDGMEIAVINGEFLGEDAGYGFGKIIRQGENFVLDNLTDEEYEKAAAKYEMLIELFTKEVD